MRRRLESWWWVAPLALALAPGGCHLVFPFGVIGVDAGPADGASTDVVNADAPRKPDLSHADGTYKPDAKTADAKASPDKGCVGCLKGAKCLDGSTTSACGAGGSICMTCTAGECQTPTCVGGSCKPVNKAEGAPCTGGSCHNGQCCKDCWDGKLCQPGTTIAACGSAGKTCVACPTPPPTSCIASYVCKAAACTPVNAADGTTCSPSGKAGTCHNGVCCDGCWDTAASKCIAPGNTSNTQCGAKGDPCDNCTLNPACYTGICNLFTYKCEKKTTC